MAFESRQEFIEYYEVFLKINQLLQYEEDFEEVEVTDEYEGLVYDLISYIENLSLTEELHININFPKLGGVPHMHTVLMEELELLKEMNEE